MNQSSVINTRVLTEISCSLQATPFRPRRLFRSGHAQTILGYLYPRRNKLLQLLREDEMRLFEVEPGVKLLIHCRWQKLRKESPTLLLVHGLEGSSSSVYMLGTAAKAFEAGFNVLRLNLRTCGETEHLTQTLYHSGMSEDLRSVIKELISVDNLNSIYLGGFSLGGNMSLKLAGEYGINAPPELRGVAAISPPIDLAACADAIESRSNWLYNRRFINNLKKRMVRVQQLYPEIYSIENLSPIRTIREFDSHITARYGGFKDVDDYYSRSSSLPLIKQICVPTLIIHAQDDPFIPFKSFKNRSLAENPFVTLLAPKHGGHVGFVAEKAASNEDRFWAENRLVEFFNLLSDINKE